MIEIKGKKVSVCAHINFSVCQSDVINAGFFLTSDIKKLNITFNTKNMEFIDGEFEYDLKAKKKLKTYL
jgi:hypothetical protein